MATSRTGISALRLQNGLTRITALAFSNMSIRSTGYFGPNFCKPSRICKFYRCRQGLGSEGFHGRGTDTGSFVPNQ